MKKENSNNIGVFIFVNDNMQKNILLQELLYGIEEEQVLSIIEYHYDRCDSETDLKTLAHLAAQSSYFGVGIALSIDGVALHHKNLCMENPVYLLSGHNLNARNCRTLGMISARLIKKFILPELEIVLDCAED